MASFPRVPERSARTSALGWCSPRRSAGVASIPATVLIGPDGTVFWQGNPALLRGHREAEAACRRALEGQLALVAARDE